MLNYSHNVVQSETWFPLRASLWSVPERVWLVLSPGENHSLKSLVGIPSQRFSGGITLQCWEKCILCDCNLERTLAAGAWIPLGLIWCHSVNEL